MKHALRGMIAAGLWLAVGCDGAGEVLRAEGAEGTVRLPTTRVPAEEGLLVDWKVEPDVLYLRYDGAPPAFAPGDVVHGSEGPGYLRRVLDVATLGDWVLLRTAPAALADAFESIDVEEVVRVPATASPALGPHVARHELVADGRRYTAEVRYDAVRSSEVAARARSASVVWELPNVTITVEDPEGRVAMQLSADQVRVAKTITLDFAIKFGLLKVEKLRFVTEDDTIASIDSLALAVTGEVPVFDQAVPLFEDPALAVLPIGPFVFTVGAGVELGAEIVLGAAAEVRTSSEVGFHSWRKQGVIYGGSWSVVDERQLVVDADLGPLQVDVAPLTVDAEIYLRAAVRFALYGIIGPETYGKVAPLHAALEIDTQGVHGELSANASAGARFVFPFFDLAGLDVTFAEWHHSYGSYSRPW